MFVLRCTAGPPSCNLYPQIAVYITLSVHVLYLSTKQMGFILCPYRNLYVQIAVDLRSLKEPL